MPNYVYSQVHILGYAEDVKHFEFKANDEDSSKATNFIEQLLPLPEEATKTITTPNGTGFTVFATLQDDGFDGYQAAVNLWGSKWVAVTSRAVSPVSIDDKNLLHIEYICESAWSPAMPAIKKISEMFPNLLFGISFLEEQPAFAGAICYNNGSIVDEIDTFDMIPEPEVQDDDDGNAWGIYWEELSSCTVDSVKDLVFDSAIIQSYLVPPLPGSFQVNEFEIPQSIFEY